MVALLGVHAGLLLALIPRTFITVDEAMGVAAGISYWRTGRFIVYRVNPPLAKMLAVLPALAAQPETDFRNLRDSPHQRAEFQAGLNFTNLNRPRIFYLICLSRLTGVIWSVLGGWICYRWTRQLYGGAAGCLALTLWCFEPYILGHAALATTDVPATVAGLLASYLFWRYLRTPSWGRAGLAGVALGIAALTKFTLLILFVLWPTLWAVRRMLDRGRTPWPLRIPIGQMLLILVLSLEIINAGYGCQGTGQFLGDYQFMSRLLAGDQALMPGNRFRGTLLASVPVPLPEDFVRGIDVQRIDFEGNRLSYLAGTWSRGGWWYYYLYALAVKLPLGTLILSAWGSLAAFGPNRSIRRFDMIMPLSTAVTILAFISMQTGYTQHSRYMMPALPYLMINAGQLVGDRSEPRKTWVTRLTWGLLLGTVLSSLWTYPHSLSYFNEAAGGPLRGHDHLVDSNIDWGQDLLYLKEWQEAHPEARQLKLAYYNFQIDPGLVDLTSEPPPPGPQAISDGKPAGSQAIGPVPGYYAVSVNFLRGADFVIADGRGGFRTTRPHEFEYFRAFRPIARAGYSIYIYHITPEQVDLERRRLGLAPLVRQEPQ